MCDVGKFGISLNITIAVYKVFYIENKFYIIQNNAPAADTGIWCPVNN